MSDTLIWSYSPHPLCPPSSCLRGRGTQGDGIGASQILRPFEKASPVFLKEKNRGEQHMRSFATIELSHVRLYCKTKITYTYE
jgi:hypothetical protein